MRFAILILLVSCVTLPAQAPKPDPLPSWNDTATKKAIVDFVTKVTTPGNPDYVPSAERIATFDNDGTLWCEQPMYVQVLFDTDRIRAMAPQHPEWQTTQPFKAVLERDKKTLAAAGEQGFVKVVAGTHAGMSAVEYEETVREWLRTHEHPRFKRPYTSCIYQPMLEVLAYLRSKEFKTYIVSGGTIDFMRPYTDKAYGIPPEQVVGTNFKTKYVVKPGGPEILLEPEVNLVDDHAGKPVGIDRFIGRRPIMAFGNSDGDFDMLEWTTTAKGARFGLIVHHTDAEREYAYDRTSPIGRLDKALDAAPKRGWVVASMKDDWKTIFPPLAK